ncbi:MAG: hypothetical protein KJ626_07885 [Verrucomicrobia bacterium]|nr:hypothetical protein [Verrucomicrobiota bacterium]
MKKRLIIALIAILPILASADAIWKTGEEYTYCGGDWKYAGCTAASLVIHVGVWPVAWGHSVHVVYSSDGWQSASVVDGGWLDNVPNPYGGYDELWQVQIPIGYTSMGGQLRPTDYAIWVVNGYGEASWDNNGGYDYHYDGTGGIDSWRY